MWAKPRAAPPPSARPMRGRRGGGGGGGGGAAATGGGAGAGRRRRRGAAAAGQAEAAGAAGRQVGDGPAPAGLRRRAVASFRRVAPAVVHISHRDTDPTNMCFATGCPLAYSPGSVAKANAFARPRSVHSGCPEPEPRRAVRPTHVPLHRFRPPVRSRSAPPSFATSCGATSPASCPTTISGRCACRTAGTSSAMRRCCAWPCPTAS